MKSVTVFSNEYIENDARILYFIIKDLCGKCNTILAEYAVCQTVMRDKGKTA